MEQVCIPVGCVLPTAVVIVGEVGSGPDPPQFPLGVGLDLIPLNVPLGCELDLILLNVPLGCEPGSDPPQFPPWVWAWI